MKTIAQIEQQGYWDVNDLKCYLVRWRQWIKSGVGETPTLMPEIVDAVVEALDLLEDLRDD